MLAVHNACERLVCGERTGSGCQSQHRIRLGFDEIGDRTAVNIACFALVFHDDDFGHDVPFIGIGLTFFVLLIS